MEIKRIAQYTKGDDVTDTISDDIYIAIENEEKRNERIKKEIEKLLKDDAMDFFGRKPLEYWAQELIESTKEIENLNVFLDYIFSFIKVV